MPATTKVTPVPAAKAAKAERLAKAAKVEILFQLSRRRAVKTAVTVM